MKEEIFRDVQNGFEFGNRRYYVPLTRQLTSEWAVWVLAKIQALKADQVPSCNFAHHGLTFRGRLLRQK